MARVKTILADPTLNAGATGPRATSAEFGSARAAGLQNLSQGLQMGAQAAESSMARSLQREAHLKALDDATTVNNANAYLRKASTEFLLNPENQGKDTYHTDYESYMEKAKELVQTGKVSPEASVHIESSFNSIVSSGYEHALSKVVAGKVEAASSAIESSFSSDISAMLSGQMKMDASMSTTGELGNKTTPGEVLAGHTEAVLNSAIGQSESLFKGILPRRAKVMQEAFVREAVTRLSDADPVAAREVLGKFSTKVDAETFKGLSNHIDVLQKQQETELKLNMVDLTKQVLTGAYNGKLTDLKSAGLTEFSFAKVYGPKEGKRRFSEFQQEYSAVEDARKSYDFMKGMNAQAQTDMLASFDKQYADKPHGQRAIHLLHSMVQDNQEKQDKDPLSWLTSNNSAVGASFENYVRVAKENPDKPEMAAAASQEYLDRVIQYQGVAPEGSDEVEAAMYLGRNRPDVMSKSMAKKRAEAFATASPDKFMQMLGELKQAFPTTAKMNLALSNLMEASTDKSVDKSYQIFLQNMNNPNLPAIIEATRKSADLKTIGDDKVLGLETSMKTLALPQFRAMARGLGGSREDSVKAAHDVVRSYASRLMTMKEDMTADQAVVAAYNQVVGFSLHSDNVNGYDALIPKEVGNVRFPDEQMPELARALQHGIDNFDSSNVNTSHFPKAVAMLEDPVKRAEAIQQLIREKARVTVSADGTAMQLLLTDDYDNPYVLTDKSGKPYQVDIVEDLAKSGRKTKPRPDAGMSATPNAMWKPVYDGSFQWRTDGVPTAATTYWPLRTTP